MYNQVFYAVNEPNVNYALSDDSSNLRLDLEFTPDVFSVIVIVISLFRSYNTTKAFILEIRKLNAAHHT